MEQEPLCAFPTAHFPWNWNVQEAQKWDVVGATLHVHAGNQATGL
jgi:hypothetical protein